MDLRRTRRLRFRHSGGHLGGQGQAQQIIGVGGVRIGRQNLSIERRRLIQTAGLMVGDGGFQVCLGHCAAELHGAQVAGVALKQ